MRELRSVEILLLFVDITKIEILNYSPEISVNTIEFVLLALLREL